MALILSRETDLVPVYQHVTMNGLVYASVVPAEDAASFTNPVLSTWNGSQYSPLATTGLPASMAIMDGAYGNGVYVMAIFDYSETINKLKYYRSTDGLAWTNVGSFDMRTSFTETSFGSKFIDHDGTRWYRRGHTFNQASYNMRVEFSLDGTSWTLHSSAAGNPNDRVAFFGPQYTSEGWLFLMLSVPNSFDQYNYVGRGWATSILDGTNFISSGVQVLAGSARPCMATRLIEGDNEAVLFMGIDSTANRALRLSLVNAVPTVATTTQISFAAGVPELMPVVQSETRAYVSMPESLLYPQVGLRLQSAPLSNLTSWTDETLTLNPDPAFRIWTGLTGYDNEVFSSSCLAFNGMTVLDTGGTWSDSYPSDPSVETPLGNPRLPRTSETPGFAVSLVQGPVNRVMNTNMTKIAELLPLLLDAEPEAEDVPQLVIDLNGHRLLNLSGSSGNALAVEE